MPSEHHSKTDLIFWGKSGFVLAYSRTAWEVDHMTHHPYGECMDLALMLFFTPKTLGSDPRSHPGTNTWAHLRSSRQLQRSKGRR